MIALAHAPRKPRQTNSIGARFLELLPIVRRQAYVAFQTLPRQQREEFVAEVIANAYCAFVRLVRQNKDHAAYATSLAEYAVRHVRAGRQVGTKLNVRDVTSRYCQRQKQIVVERLDRYDEQEEEWRELLLEDRHAGPAQLAAMRIDFEAWLLRLPRRLRRIAEMLALGETTKATARKFRLSPARISQLRRELRTSWELYVGDNVPASAA